jgi:broad specificity phosphatase PhoE
MLLYLIRHGTTAHNAEQRHQGWTDVPLSEQGRREAAATGEHLRSVAFGRLLSSDLRRAVETARLIHGEEAALEVRAELRETDIGRLDGVTFADAEARYGQDYLRNRERFDYAPYGGEGQGPFIARARRALDELAGSCHPNGPDACVVTHGGFLKACVAALLDCPTAIPRTSFSNCGISTFQLRSDGWHITRLNSTDHLRK